MASDIKTIVFIGNESSGKSTIIGNILGHNDAQLLKCADDGGNLKYARVVDKVDGERLFGRTIVESYYQHLNLTLINVPGHFKNNQATISGISSADYAVLVLSAGIGEYEAGIDDNCRGQTIQHALAAYAFGIRQLIVVVNKMDEYTVGYSQTRFNEIKLQTIDILRNIGYESVENIPFIPVSGWLGDNLYKKSDREELLWYDGPHLLQELIKLNVPPRPDHEPLRISINNCFWVTGVGYVHTGRIKSGSLKVNSLLYSSPSFITGELRSIEKYLTRTNTANTGDMVGLSFPSNMDFKSKKGDIICNYIGDPPSRTKSFQAQIVIQSQPYPTQITVGYSPTLYCHNLTVKCKISKILCTINKNTLESITTNENDKIQLQSNDMALVQIQTDKYICVEAYSQYPSLARIILRDHGFIIAYGIIKSIIKEDRINQN